MLPGGQFVRGLGVLQEQGVFSGPQILLLILEICLKDEAVPEAPKEGVRVLVHCEAGFRGKYRSHVNGCLQEGQLSLLKLCLVTLFVKYRLPAPLHLHPGELMFNCKYFLMLSRSKLGSYSGGAQPFSA